jgi:hypothetical protein
MLALITPEALARAAKRVDERDDDTDVTPRPAAKKAVAKKRVAPPVRRK